MCGIVGFWSASNKSTSELKNIAFDMSNKIAHRGPDASGIWTDEKIGLAFGHQRLSILDLSTAGHQPMISHSGRFVMVFNGEIYNHLELRSELELICNKGLISGDKGGNIRWRGSSDTETLLAGFEHWGIEPTLSKTIGMFSIALWDTTLRTLYLARDRFGEKPLYYGWTHESNDPAFVFGSELKALRAAPDFRNPICRQALMQYMRFMYVPAPRSIYSGIYKLEPGCLLSIKENPPKLAPEIPLRPPALHSNLTIKRWWSIADVVEAGCNNQLTDQNEAIDKLEHRLAAAVKLQTLSDVPLGAFLSGGIDSSTIVALMQKNAVTPVKTFTVGFHETEFDEAPYANAVATQLGTDHTALYVSAVEAQEVISCLPEIYDEPFADSSQIPTHLVSRVAREHVTVALSGDGGDELFGGYNRYFWGPKIWAKVSWLPYPLRDLLGLAISVVPNGGWNALSKPINAILPANLKTSQVGEKANKLSVRLRNVSNIDDLYASLISEWQDPASVVRSDDCNQVIEPKSFLSDSLPKCLTVGDNSGISTMMYRDTVSYLPDDILCKVDRAAMAVGLETRTPFLDHRVAELAWQMPLNIKMINGHGKWPLRQVLYRYVSPEIVERPKAGFAIPIGQWLRGPLKPWAESLLSQKRLDEDGYFYSAPIRKKWTEHLSGSHDHTASLWAVIMFQAWLSHT